LATTRAPSIAIDLGQPGFDVVKGGVDLKEHLPDLAICLERKNAPTIKTHAHHPRVLAPLAAALGYDSPKIM
jgi:hypothetical protein